MYRFRQWFRVAAYTARSKEYDPRPTALLALLALFALLFTSSVHAANYYVNPANPLAADDGPGTSTTPFKTISAAVLRLVQGDALYIAAGVYRETIDLRKALSLRDVTIKGVPQTRIEAMAGAQVTIKGSDVVDGWEALGNGVYIKRNWTANSQQVFLDGMPLKQIGGVIFNGYGENPTHPLASLHREQGGIWPGRTPGDANNLVENSFYYDIAAQNLYIKVPYSGLSGRVVEVSVRPFLLMGEELKNVFIQNLRFKHANTTAFNPSGAITLSGNSLDLNNIHVEQVDGAGFDVTGNKNVIRNSSADYCGQLGMKVRGRNVTLLYNRTNYNNTRDFNKWWEAGGAKFVGLGGLQDSSVVGHQAYGNNGDGLWFDWQNRNNKIHNNRLAYNKGMGLHYEASSGAQIYRNYIFANRQRGVYLPNTANSVIAHNLIAHNGLEAIVIVDERNAVEQNKIDWIPVGNYVVGNLIVSSGASIVLPGKGLTGNVSEANLFISPTGWLTFSVNWITASNPPIAGLTNWRALTGLDLYSWNQSLAISAQLAKDFQLMKPYPDFSVELAQAESYAMPRGLLPESVGSLFGEHPGPKP